MRFAYRTFCWGIFSKISQIQMYIYSHINTEFLSYHVDKYSNLSMVALTHGQTASPTTLGKEFANFAWRIRTLRRKFFDVELKAKINGLFASLLFVLLYFYIINTRKPIVIT